MNVASFTLVFDNNFNYLNVIFNEVVVIRIIYKDGINEFFINNEKYYVENDKKDKATIIEIHFKSVFK